MSIFFYIRFECTYVRLKSMLYYKMLILNARNIYCVVKIPVLTSMGHVLFQ